MTKLLLILFLLFPTLVYADTTTVNPNEDISIDDINNWDDELGYPATTPLYDSIDEGATPDTGDFIQPEGGGSGATYVMGFETPTLNNGIVTSVKVGIYGDKGGPNPTVTIPCDLSTNGGISWEGAKDYVFDSTQQELEQTWTLRSADLNALQFKFGPHTAIGTGFNYRTLATATYTISGDTGGNDAYTMALLHCNGEDASTTFTNDAVGGTAEFTANNDVQIDTAQKRFGTGSGLFDGTGDYLTTPASSDFDFGAGDWTVDFWVRFTAHTGEVIFWLGYDASDDIVQLEKWSESGNNNELHCVIYNGGVIVGQYYMSSGWNVANDTWYHIAFVRSGAAIKIAIDGVFQTLTEATAIGSTSINAIDVPWHLGISSNHVSYPLNGWIDEFRISKGIARWTSDFIPYSTEYGSASTAVGKVIMITGG